MDRSASIPAHLLRRGSTPSLVQFATINAQIQKERATPSKTDEETSDLSSGEDSTNVYKSLSQPALNVLHVTNIRGRVNLLSLPPSKQPKRQRPKRLKEDAQISPNCLKKASSHGMLAAKAPTPTTPIPDASSRQTRRNSWCHASGTSAVAIDNKIEQAMDLVKSHLMFAVREEVEVLKERIAELMDKISQLEMENSILRASATQETLAQLSAPPPAASPPAGPVS